MRKTKVVTVAALMCLVMAAASISPFAADLSTTYPSASEQQKVVLEKTEEVTPTYTVSVPATVNLSKDAQDMSYTLDLESDDAFIPSGKKISVTIQSAGYSGSLDGFKLWSKKTFTEAFYQIYDSDRAATPHIYQIGEEIASWTGSNHGTINRRVKVLDYDSIKPGTYEGVINYTITLEDAQ